MSNDPNRFAAWAARQVSRGGGGRAPQPAPTPAYPQAAPAPAATLPPAPAGYAWAMHPAAPGGFMLMPLAGPPPGPMAAFAPAIRQPQGAVPFGVPARMPQPSRAPRTSTCALVKQGDRDTYAEMLANIPDLAPPSNGYDAMTGQPSPDTLAECAGFAEFEGAMTQDCSAFPVRGGAAPVRVIPDLVPQAAAPTDN